MAPEATPARRYFDVEYTLRGTPALITVVASTPEEAIESAQRQRHWGRNFKVIGQAANTRDTGDET